MALLTTAKPKSVVGLDIEAGSIAATEVRSNGSVEVVGHGVMALAPGIFREGEVADADSLGAAIKELFAQRKLSRSSVRLGIANQRVAVRSMRLPAIEDRDELETAIRFQAQDHIPMPLDQSVLDWQVVGHSQSESGDRRVDVVAVAARRDMLQQVMRALAVGGVRPIGIDHSAFGMIRALARETGTPVGAAQFVSAPSYEQRTDPIAGAAATVEAHIPARLYCNLGDVTNLAVARGSSCLFTRIAAFGVEGIAQKLAERRQLTLEHARQWLAYVGLERPTDDIDGDETIVREARNVLADGARRVADEARNSLDFYRAQNEALDLQRAVLTGPTVAVEGFAAELGANVGLEVVAGVVEEARPGALDGVEPERVAVAAGLAVEEQTR